MSSSLFAGFSVGNVRFPIPSIRGIRGKTAYGWGVAEFPSSGEVIFPVRIMVKMEGFE